MLLAVAFPGGALAQNITIADGVTLLNEIEPTDGLYVSLNEGADGNNNEVLIVTVRTIRAGSATCVTDFAIGDSEVVELREQVVDTDTAAGVGNGNDTGVFRAFLNTSNSGPQVVNNGTLEVRGGDRIEIVNGVVTDTAAVATNAIVSIREISEDYDPSATPVALPVPADSGAIKLVTEGNSVLIRVDDQDENCNPSIADTLTVNVTTTAGADTEAAFTLTETGPDTGIFVGIPPPATPIWVR
jgi:hypothetical protein